MHLLRFFGVTGVWKTKSTTKQYYAHFVNFAKIRFEPLFVILWNEYKSEAMPKIPDKSRNNLKINNE